MTLAESLEIYNECKQLRAYPCKTCPLTQTVYPGKCICTLFADAESAVMGIKCDEEECNYRGILSSSTFS